MLGWFPYRIRLVRSIREPRPGWVPSLRATRRRGVVVAAIAGAAGAALSVMPALAADSPASLNATITLVTYSLTVSPSSANYTSCFGGNSTAGALGFPNGFCSITGIHVTNTSTASSAHVDVQGAAANPSDLSTGGTPWTLCICSPGQDQFREQTIQGSTVTDLTTSPQCDQAFNSSNAADRCLAAPNQADSEGLTMEGPSKSTDPSTIFTTTITWTVVS